MALATGAFMQKTTFFVFTTPRSQLLNPIQRRSLSVRAIKKPASISNPKPPSKPPISKGTKPPQHNGANPATNEEEKVALDTSGEKNNSSNIKPQAKVEDIA